MRTIELIAEDWARVRLAERLAAVEQAEAMLSGLQSQVDKLATAGDRWSPAAVAQVRAELEGAIANATATRDHALALVEVEAGRAEAVAQSAAGALAALDIASEAVRLRRQIGGISAGELAAALSSADTRRARAQAIVGEITTALERAGPRRAGGKAGPKAG